jgi:hypothetical protein
MFEKTPLEHLPSMLFDEHNAELYDQVRPMKWQDPTQESGVSF